MTKTSIVAGRSMVVNQHGIVACSQPLGAKAGVQVLEQGGNAVDAAIAAAAVIAVVEPASNGLGGDLFALIHMKGARKVLGVNASGWAASGTSAQDLRERGVRRMPERGATSVTVPGMVAGWEDMRARAGTMPLSRLLASAIHYAEEGFPVSEIVSRNWKLHRRRLASDPELARTFLVNDTTPAEGEVFRNRRLARTLELIAANGTAGFYEGRNARAIVRELRRRGGSMTLADLAEFQPEWVEPISTRYRGWDVFEIPPQGQGIAALMMLGIMSEFPLKRWGLHSVRALHAMIEAKKLAYADMLRYVGDPRFGEIPVQELLSAGHAKARAHLIDMRHAAERVEPSVLDGVTHSSGSDTIYLSVVDRHGNVVSLIQSIYEEFGSGIVPRGTGFVLHNRGSLFSLAPGQPNTLAPRKRPLHTIIPGFMLKGEVRIGFGIMGGWNQAQAHAQFVSNVADHSLSIQQALEAGRFSKRTFDGRDVNVEHLVPEESRAGLARLGHVITVPPPRSKIFGWGQAVLAHDSGVNYGASEPRHDGQAIPESPPEL